MNRCSLRTNHSNGKKFHGVRRRIEMKHYQMTENSEDIDVYTGRVRRDGIAIRAERLGVGPEAQNKVRTVTSVLGGDGRVSFQNSDMPYRVVCRKHPECSNDRSVYQLKLMRRCGGQNAPLLEGLDAKHRAARPAPTRSKRKGIL